jgi:hypothetical protein
VPLEFRNAARLGPVIITRAVLTRLIGLDHSVGNVLYGELVNMLVQKSCNCFGFILTASPNFETHKFILKRCNIGLHGYVRHPDSFFCAEMNWVWLLWNDAPVVGI